MLKLGFSRIRRSGLSAFSPPAGNVIGNWAGTGTGGTGGLPDGWLSTTIPGVAFSVLGRTPYRGGNVIDFQFVGTTTVGGAIVVQPASSIIATVAPDQIWRIRLFAERVGVAAPAEMTARVHWRTSAQAFIAAGNSAPINGLIAGPGIAPADSLAPATSALAGMFLFAQIPTGQLVNLRYKVFAPTMVRVS
jgi:hypothetical protein